MVEFVRDFDMKLTVEEPYEFIAHIQAQLMIDSKIIETQAGDELLKKMREGAKNDGKSEWRVGTDGGLRYRGRLCVPNLQGLQEEVLNAAHNFKLAIHPVKAEHRRPPGLLQPMLIAEWKWDFISMDFIAGLPKTRKGYDSIWVIVDRLTKSAHFLPIKTSSSADDLAKLYSKEIVRLHGVPLEIVSDRDTRFTSIFWTRIQEAMGESWDDCLPYAEFAYNNNFQASIGMVPYEALYGRPCRAPHCWEKIGEKGLLGQDLVRITTEKIGIIRRRLLTGQSRQKLCQHKAKGLRI
ncbi:uncharacterized protein LOC131235633 [Magnolia sinica]|uniref:uncharacterized protein LOC131235633 n=1 Tax=Magnolia sinica TaxID=86752 RepID=UPI0026581B61|nr:uncharacterized protein LOC131235633 [Magnolia sinica]